MQKSESNSRLKAVLVSVQLPGVSAEDLQSSLAELTRLVTTLGYDVIGQLTQKRDSDRQATLLGEGKLKELAEWTKGPEDESDEDGEENDGDDSANDDDSNDDKIDEKEESQIARPTGRAEIVIVDCDLSPSQLRNLEGAAGVQVLDRTGVIIEIFSRHARTKAARLQVEIARLVYMAPRLRETGGGADRQGGGIGGKGAGETSLELDRRRIRDRIKELKDELAAIGNEHQLRRARREKEITVALVGYTNAGKSSLMRAMTGSEVLVADKLFATLDTTIRPIHPETIPKILLSDTVGFIKKLPHDLVASFKSTLDEASHASLLLFVVDASDGSFRSQLAVTKEVLAEVGVTDVPSLLVLNKQDRLKIEERSQLAAEFPDAFFMSTRSPEDLKRLRDTILSFFEKDMVEEDLFIPYTAQGVVGDVRSRSRVLMETYDERGVTLKIRVSTDVLSQFHKRLQKDH